MHSLTENGSNAFVSGLLRAGQGYVEPASVCRLAADSAAPTRHPRIFNFRYVLDGLWYPGSGTKSAATTPLWLRDNPWNGRSFAGRG